MHIRSYLALELKVKCAEPRDWTRASLSCAAETSPVKAPSPVLLQFWAQQEIPNFSMGNLTFRRWGLGHVAHCVTCIELLAVHPVWGSSIQRVEICWTVGCPRHHRACVNINLPLVEWNLDRETTTKGPKRTKEQTKKRVSSVDCLVLPISDQLERLLKRLGVALPQKDKSKVLQVTNQKLQSHRDPSGFFVCSFSIISARSQFPPTIGFRGMAQIGRALRQRLRGFNGSQTRGLSRKPEKGKERKLNGTQFKGKGLTVTNLKIGTTAKVKCCTHAPRYRSYRFASHKNRCIPHLSRELHMISLDVKNSRRWVSKFDSVTSSCCCKRRAKSSRSCSLSSSQQIMLHLACQPYLIHKN